MDTVHFRHSTSRSLKLEVIELGVNDPIKKKSEKRHRHSFHTILFLTEGKSIQEIDFQEYYLQENQIIILPAGSIHKEEKIECCRGYLVLFDEEFFSPHQNELLSGLIRIAVIQRKLLIDINPENTTLISQYFQLLKNEHDAAVSENQVFILQNLMLALLNRLEDMIRSKGEGNTFITHSRPFQRFIDLVEKNYREQKNLDFYVGELNITKRKLNDAVKKSLGVTPTNVIINRTILESKRELYYSEKSVKEIAYSLGYENPNYFSRLFKNRLGVSPEAFRSRYVI